MGTSISAPLLVRTAVPGVQPGPIAALTPSGITSGSVVLTWTNPTIGDTPFRFKVQQAPAGPNPQWADATGFVNVLTAAISGLVPVTGYQFQVLAFNGSGSSTSPTVQVTTLPLLPGPPLNLAVVGQPTINSVSLSWLSPAVLGTPPVTFQVSYRLAGTGPFTPGPTSTTTSATVINLAPATAYDFEVNASNGAGPGPQSATLLSVSTSSSLTLPSAPMNLLAGTITPVSAQVSWTAPAQGSDPKTYTLQYRPH